MFERFTRRSRRVLAAAQEETVVLGHNFLGTEHILLGLLRERDGVAGRVLHRRGVTYDRVRDLVLDIVGGGAGAVGLRDADALAAIGIDLEVVRSAVEDAFGEGALDRPRPPRRSGAPKFVPRAKKTVELSLREALALGHNYIGTEHLLLAITSLGEGVAVKALEQVGVSPASLRDDILAELAVH